MSQKDECPLYCKHCGAKLRLDPVGHYCPTHNRQWQFGAHGCPVRGDYDEKSQDA